MLQLWEEVPVDVSAGTRRTLQYLRVVLCVSGLEGDKLQIQRTAEVHGGDNVPADTQLSENRPTAAEGAALSATTYCNCGMIPDLSVTGVMGVIGVMGQKGEAPVPCTDMDDPSWASYAAVASWDLKSGQMPLS